MATPAHRLYDINGHGAATDAQAEARADAKADSADSRLSWADSRADRVNRADSGRQTDSKTGRSPRAGAVVPGGRVVGRGGRCEETVVLNRDPLEPEVWWFGHLIDGDLGKQGHLRHDRSTHETTLITGHDGGVYADARRCSSTRPATRWPSSRRISSTTWPPSDWTCGTANVHIREGPYVRDPYVRDRT